MNSKYTLSIFLLIISITSGFSQHNPDAEHLIEKYVQEVQQKTIQTDFILKISEKNNVNSQSFLGKAILRADKFFLEMDELTIWFDGKTQWTYMSNINEVTITEPDTEELAQTNPTMIIAAFKSVSNINFSKTKNTTNHIIELTPKIKKADFNKIEVCLNKKNHQLKSIKINYKNGLNNELIFTNYKQSKGISNSVFKLDASKTKGAYVNDLR